MQPPSFSSRTLPSDFPINFSRDATAALCDSPNRTDPTASPLSTIAFLEGAALDTALTCTAGTVTTAQKINARAHIWRTAELSHGLCLKVPLCLHSIAAVNVGRAHN